MLKRVRTEVTEGSKAHLRRLMKRSELSPVTLRDRLQASRILLIATVRNEKVRLPYFLDYYRQLGVEHFIIIDNGSTDGVLAYLSEQGDVSTYSAQGEYKRSRFGNDWVNEVLRRHGAGKWVVYVDPDEFLVFPGSDRMTLHDLTDHMDRSGQKSLKCLLLDMYSDRPVPDNVYLEGSDPVDVCPLFDKAGYHFLHEASACTTWIKGGLRGRLYFQSDVTAGPALNKVPLVRWRKHYAYLKSSHQVWPLALNAVDEEPGFVSGVLLHFKFFASFNDKVAEERVRQQHDREYASYRLAPDDRGESWVSPATGRFRDWTDLDAAGLLWGCDWFDRNRTKPRTKAASRAVDTLTGLPSAGLMAKEQLNRRRS